jgi:two-component system cell cycle response regulator
VLLDEHLPVLVTPLLPQPLLPRVVARATLTLLTGPLSGRFLAIEKAPLTIGRAHDAGLVIDDLGLSRYHARVGRGPGARFFVEDIGSMNGTYLRGRRIRAAALQAGDVLQLGPNVRLGLAVLDSAEEMLRRQLYDSAVHDSLTRAFSREYLVARLLAEVARARRENVDVVVMMIDVDRFKDINDRFGHLAGDRALRSIASSVQRVLRAGDILARYGGDEFVVLLSVGTSPAETAVLADRVRRSVEGLQMSARGEIVAVTASIGAAALTEVQPSDDPVAALLALADARMFDAKVSGRDRAPAPGPRLKEVAVRYARAR